MLRQKVFTRRNTFCPWHLNILLRKEHDMNSVFITPNDCPGADDSASIQNAVDRAHETGLNLVLIPRINERTGKPLWRIARDILLPSDMTVLLVNCRLEMEDDVYSGFFRNTNFTKPETRTPEGRQSLWCSAQKIQSIRMYMIPQRSVQSGIIFLMTVARLIRKHLSTRNRWTPNE